MREIEFRGKRVDNGEYVYGDLVHVKGVPYIYVADSRFAKADTYYDIAPNSVAQFVGRDANGKKGYEGDTLIHASGEEWIAALGSYARNKAGLATYNFKKLTLKEAQKSSAKFSLQQT